MTWLRADTSERDTERRFKILEGCKFDLEKARILWGWVQAGDRIAPVVVGEFKDAR